MSTSTYRFNRGIILTLLLLFSAYYSLGEGTKEIQPDKNTPAYFSIGRSSISVPFANYNASEEWRWNIRTCAADEVIYIGLRYDGNMRFRIKNSAGTVVFSERNIPTSGPGYINTWEEAVAGPNTLVGPAGYTPLVFAPGAADDYYIEFDAPANPNRVLGLRFVDITVADAAGNIKTGRNWSKSWTISTGSFTNPFLGTMFMYSDDQIVTSVDFNGIQPYHFVVTANATGTVNSGDFENDRQSQLGLVNYPLYKVFLNDPDEDCYPTGQFGSLTSPVTLSGCHDQRCINVSVDQAGYTLITLDLNSTPGFQDNSEDIQIYTDVVPGTNCIPWDARNGLGVDVPDGTTINLQIDYFNGITHLPMYDAEEHDNGYHVELIRPSGGTPQMFWDDRNISGGTHNLTGCTGDCHTWDYDRGNINTLNTYWYANILNANVPITVDQITVDANRNTPGTGAANDTTICIGTTLQLAGSITGVPGGTWSTSGTGTFSDINDLNAIYTPSPSDTSNGSVLITLTTDVGTGCTSRSDVMNVTFKQGPDIEITATVDQPQQCDNNPTIVLTATIESTTQANCGECQGGVTSITFRYEGSGEAEIEIDDYFDGDVDPGDTFTIYGDKSNGKFSEKNLEIEIELDDDDDEAEFEINTQCKDDLIDFSVAGLTIIGGTSHAGGELCSDYNTTTESVEIEWRGGNGTYYPDNRSENTVYTPTQDEIDQGSITLYVVPLNTGEDCATTGNSVTVTFEPAPEVLSSSGPDTLISCSPDGSIQLAGNITYSTPVPPGQEGSWSGGYGSFSPSRDDINAIYTPHWFERWRGKVTLTLNSNDDYGCNTVSSNVTILFDDPPTLDAGSSQLICSNDPTVDLTATISHNYPVIWSGGNGTFSQTDTLHPTYTLSASELTMTSIWLTVEIDEPNLCEEIKDSVEIIIQNDPTLDVGDNTIFLCENNANVALNATNGNSGGVEWLYGLGTFVPSNTVPNPTYIPHPDELAAGVASVVARTTSNNGCAATSDTILMIYSPAQTVSLPPLPDVCANNSSINLLGSGTDASHYTWSVGTGTFSPDANSLDTWYTPSPADIAGGTISVTLTAHRSDCNPVDSTVSFNISPAPVVDAGPNQTICENNTSIQLNGSVTGASGGIWSNGTGTFSTSNTDLNASYQPTATEINAGSMFLVLSSTGNGICNAESDTLFINFSPEPTVDAGIGDTLCANNATITLNGTSSTGAGIWRNGGGTFAPNNNSLNTSYNPSAAEIASGSIYMVLASDANGICNMVEDSVEFIFTPLPVVSISSDTTLCEDVTSISLSADVSVVSSILWSGGSGTYSPSNMGTDITYFPTATELANGYVNVIATSTDNGNCLTLRDNKTVVFEPQHVVNAGSDQTLCGNVTQVAIAGSVLNSSGGTWNSSSGGTFADATDLNTDYFPTSTDISNKEVTLYLLSDAGGACPQRIDSMLIEFTDAPVLNMSADRSVCEGDLPINLNVSGSPGSWSGGTGSYTPNVNSQNAIYSPSASEVASGSVSLTFTTVPVGICPSLTDDVTYTILEGPNADAGPDQTLCASEALINLNGSVSNAGGGFWSLTGFGSLVNPPNNLSNQYNVSSLDTSGVSTTQIAAVLQTTGNGICASASDTAYISFEPAPSVDAGPDQVLCATTSAIQLNGQTQNTTSVQWTGGAGSFAPSANQASVDYTPTAAELSAGSVNLTLNGTAAGVCPNISDNLNINFDPAPSVNAGTDMVICEDSAFVQLNGTVINALGGYWLTNGNGSFSTNFADLNARYFFVPADTVISTFAFTLVSDGNGTCDSVTSTIVVTKTPLPVLSAGNDTTICGDGSSVNIAANISFAHDIVWTSSGSGTFSNSSSLNTIYTPSAADITNGVVALTVSTTNTGICRTVSDFMVLNLEPEPSVNAGFDQLICANQTEFVLNGSSNNSSTSLWETVTASGSFNDPLSLISTYYIHNDDITRGYFEVSLQSTDYGVCSSAYDTVRVDLENMPIVDAGPDLQLCADTNSFGLHGQVQNANNGQWSTTGDGSFFPSANDSIATYVMSSTDISNGAFSLIFENEAGGICPVVRDTVDVQLTTNPVLDAGRPIEACTIDDSVQLAGQAPLGTNVYWVSTGSGTFAPDSTSPQANYLPSALDITTGLVHLTLISTDTGTCSPLPSSTAIVFNPTPEVTTGPNQTICANVFGVPVNASYNNHSSIAWTTTGSGIFNNPSGSSGVSYFPSSSDTSAGAVDLVFTVGGMGSCPSVSDTTTLLFETIPSVTASSPIYEICNLPGSNISLNAVHQHTTGGFWTSNGLGSFSPSNTNEDVQYTIHPDDTLNSLSFTFMTDTTLICPAVSDFVRIDLDLLPTVDVGNDMSVCADMDEVIIDVTASNFKDGYWSSNGSGRFAPDSSWSTVYYAPSSADKSSGSVILSFNAFNDLCPATSDDFVLNFTPLPTISAGPDIDVCIGIDTINLSANYTIAGGVFWSTLDGDGTFHPDNGTDDTQYLPTVNDQARGSLEMIVTTHSAGDCQNYTDTVNVNFTPSPTIDAGPDKTVCLNDMPVTLEGSGTSGQWSGGTGTYSPSNLALNASYTPSVAETTAGSVKLYLTTITSGSCIPSIDSVTISFESAPTMGTIPDVDVCNNETDISLNASPGGTATGVAWQSNGSGTFDDAANNSPLYTFSSSDLNQDSLSFTVTTTGNAGGLCPAVSETFYVRISPEAILLVSDTFTVCANNNLVAISSSVNHATGVNWTGGSGTFSPDRNSTNISYTPSSSEIGVGEAVLTLNSTGSAVCSEVNRNVIVEITPAPVVQVGAPGEICTVNTTVPITSSVTNATSVVWSSSGSGSFDNLNSFSTNYNTNTDDTLSNTITFTATSTGNGICLPESADTTINIINQPVVFAGANTDICITDSSITLNGTISNSQSQVWSSSGSGTFDDSTSLNATYQFSNDDYIAGGFALALSSDSNIVCPERSHQFSVSLIDNPTVIANADLDILICETDPSVELNGSYTNAEGIFWSGGNGSFTPDSSFLQVNYNPTSIDTANGQVALVLTTINTGACAPVSDTVVVFFQDEPMIFITDTIQVCADTSAIPLDLRLKDAGGVYWTTSNDGIFISSPIDTNASYVLSANEISLGQTLLNVTSTQNGVCDPDEQNVLIEIQDLPVLSVMDDFTICSSEPSLNLSSTVLNAGNINWTTTNGNGSFSSNGTNAVYDLDPSDPALNILNFTATSTNNGWCQAVSEVANVHIQMLPSLDLGLDLDLCETQTSISPTLSSANLASGIVWTSNGVGHFTPNTNDANAVYMTSQSDINNGSVQISISTQGDTICPVVQDDVSYNFIEVPSISLNTGMLCVRETGVSLSASATSGATGSWSTLGSGNFDIGQNNYIPSFDDISNKQFELVYTTNAGHVCGSQTESVLIKIDGLPKADAGRDAYICRGGDTYLNAGANSIPVQYEWYHNGGTIGTGSSVQVTVPIQETYVLEVTDNQGCQVYDTVNIYTYDLPILAMPAHHCLYQTTLLDGTPSPDATVPGVYQWYLDGQVINQENTPIYDPRYAGTHTLVFDYQGCFTDASTLVTDLPELETDSAIACYGEFAVINTTHYDGATYDWSYQGLNFGSSSTATVTAALDTNYIVVEVTDSLGCQSLDSAQIIGIVSPQPNLVDTSICNGSPIVFASNPLNQSQYSQYDMEYEWRHEGDVNASSITNPDIVRIAIYTVTLTIDQCISVDTSLITVFANPRSQLQDDITFCSDDTPFVTANLFDPSSRYLWSTGDTTALIDFYEEGQYSVTITNQYDCSIRDSIQINEVCDPKIYVPNAFKPGSEGDDKLFRVFGKDFTGFKITIFNRWGEIIFYSEDPKFAWDGSYLGEYMPIGAYPFIIEYRSEIDPGAEPTVEEGRVNIIR